MLAEISPFLRNFGQRIGLKGWVSWAWLDVSGAGRALTCMCVADPARDAVRLFFRHIVCDDRAVRRIRDCGCGNRLLTNALIMFEIDLEIVKNIEA